MRSVFLDAQLEFDTDEAAAVSEDVLLRILGVMARLSLYQLRKNPGLPTLYSKAAGIRWCPPDQMTGPWIKRNKIREFTANLQAYGAEDDKIAILLRLVTGAEIFQDVLTLYRSKKGDCDRLVVTRLAELWRAGIIASPYLIPHLNDRGGTTYHAVVLHVDNTTEDPSAILWMAGPEARAAEIRKNYERRDNMLMEAAKDMFYGGDPDMLGARVDAAAYVPFGGF